MRIASLWIVATSMLAACGGRGDRGPKWPEIAEREEDGGESLAPRQASAIESGGDTSDVVATAPVETPVAATPASETAATPTPATPTPATTTEDPLIIEEIVIEVED